MRKILIILLLLPLSLVGIANDSTRVYQGYSGGMMVHLGYLFTPHSQLPSPIADALGDGANGRGCTYGIGGAARVHLWKHLRLGCEGFVSTQPSSATNLRHSLASGSYVRSGWGGVLADACWRLKKVWPYVGGTIGGGAMRSLYIVEGDENDWEEETHAVFHKQAFFCLDPYVGMDWCMTSKVHMTFRMDWLLALHKGDVVYPTGPRIYVGFMFCH